MAKMKEEARVKLYLDRLLKHQETTRSKKFYAINRIDLLLISISGAGIYTIFEMIKFFFEKDQIPDLMNLKLAGCSFVITIIINFISQWFGFYSNKSEDEIIEFQIDKEKGDNINDLEFNSIIKRRNVLRKLTHILNIISTIVMVVGILQLTMFILNIL